MSKCEFFKTTIQWKLQIQSKLVVICLNDMDCQYPFFSLYIAFSFQATIEAYLRCSKCVWITKSTFLISVSGPWKGQTSQREGHFDIETFFKFSIVNLWSCLAFSCVISSLQFIAHFNFFFLSKEERSL